VIPEFLFRPEGEPLTEAQRELRWQVLKQISNEPETLDMAAWEEKGRCGTTRCIAGWAQFIVRGEVRRLYIKHDAIRLLGLTMDEYYGHGEAGGLFYLDDAAALARMQELASAP
jgi:hypothetical protein